VFFKNLFTYLLNFVDIWDLIGSSTRRSRITEDGAHYAVVEFTIYLDRKPLFYVVNIITPVMFLVLVVLMVCLPVFAFFSGTSLTVLRQLITVDFGNWWCGQLQSVVLFLPAFLRSALS